MVSRRSKLSWWDHFKYSMVIKDFLYQKGIRIALIQNRVTANKQRTIRRVVELIEDAARNNAQIVSLPVY